MDRHNTQATLNDKGDNIFAAKTVPRNSVSNLSKTQQNQNDRNRTQS